MSNSKIRAIIKEINNGAYYTVILQTVPAKGEYISLYSRLDKATHNYKVVSVLHSIYDVIEKEKKSKDGYHEVTLTVQPSASSVFN